MKTTEVAERIRHGEKIVLDEGLERLRVSSLEVNATSSTIVMSAEHCAQAESIMERSLANFRITEQTLASDITGKPTLIARLDATLARGWLYAF